MSKIPTVCLYKKGRMVRINESDCDSWKKDGWTTKAPPEKAEPKAKAKK